MYINLIETYEEAADIKTKKVYQITKVLEQEEATDEAAVRLHKKRVELLAEGRDVQVIRTAVQWDDPRREVSRTRRRVMQKTMRKIMRGVKVPKVEQQAQTSFNMAIATLQRIPIIEKGLFSAVMRA